MQSFKSYIAEDLEVAELIRELTTPQLIAKVKAQTVHKKRYSYAKDLVQKIYDRKSKEGGSKGAKHGIGYYALALPKLGKLVTNVVLLRPQIPSIKKKVIIGELRAKSVTRSQLSCIDPNLILQSLKNK
jgi:hypothetical protein